LLALVFESLDFGFSIQQLDNFDKILHLRKFDYTGEDPDGGSDSES
jgi:hypothetical protein